MRFLYLFLVVLGASASPAVMAQQLECDTVYQVQSGDSLSKIAQRVYGRTTAYQAIFDFNPGKMEDPNIVSIGVNLYLPCLGRDEENVPAEQLSTLPELPARRSGGLKVLTGSEYPPYVDEGLPGGGFSVELVERSLLFDNGEADFRVDVINDWGSHLSPLLSDGAYDLAFPWFKPDCTARDTLGESSIWRCDNLLFSNPLHDVVVSFYTRADMADSLTSVADLKGLKICRPRGYFTHDLEAMGLVPDNYERVAPANPVACFEQLAEGSVDVVTVNADTTDKILTQLDMRDQTSELIDFANVQTLHVVAMRDNPQSRVNMLRLDKGLRGLLLSDDYRQIARKHLR